MATIVLPSQLAALAGGRRTLVLPAATLGELFTAFDQEAPMLRAQLIEPGGDFRPFVGFFVDERQVFAFDQGRMPLRQDAQIVVVMAVAGG